MPDDIVTLRLREPAGVGWQRGEASDGHEGVAGPATLHAMLRAMAIMARNSRRQEADVDSSLFAAGLSLPPGQRDEALSRLRDAGSIERIIPLSDGGVLVAVTVAGMGRASRAG